MRRRHRLRVDTFPFLAVLLCAMGALILILLVMDRRSRLAAAARGRENALLGAAKARPEPDGVVGEDDARLEAERKALDDEMRQVQARLAEVARELQREEEGVGNLRLEAKGKRKALRGQEQAFQAAQKEAADLKAALTAEDRARHALAAELVQLEEVIRDLKASRNRDALTYSVIPYKGKHGEQRRPLYVECTRIGHLFHPDRFELIDPSLETLRLEIARRVTRIAENRRRAGLKDERPYLMMLIRPEGVMRYYQVQSAIRDLPVEFGYEFVDADWVLHVPPEVAELAGTAEPTLSKPSPDQPIRIPSFGSAGDGIARRPGSDSGGGSADAGDSGGTGNGRGFGIPGGFGGPGSPSGLAGGPAGPFGNAPGGVGWGGGMGGRAGSPPSNLALLGLAGGPGGVVGGRGGNGSASSPGGVHGNGTGGPGGYAGREGLAGDSTGRHAGGSAGPLGDTFGGAAGGGGAGGRAGSPPSNLAILGIGGSGATGGPGRNGGSGNNPFGSSVGNGDGRGQATAGLADRGTGSSPSGAGGANPSPRLFGSRSNPGGGTQGASSSPIPPPDVGTIRIGRANPDGPTKPLFDPATPPATSEAVAKASSAIQVPSILPGAASSNPGGAGGGSGSGSPPSGDSSAGSGNASSGGSATGSGGSDEAVAQGKRRPQREGFHGADSLAPPPRRNRPLLPARIGEAEETTVFIECRAAGVVIHPAGQSIPLAALDQAAAKNALRQAVMDQLAMHKGNPARRQVRFLIHRDAERTFHAAYPVLDDIRVDKTRYTLQPGDDVSRLILVD